MTNLIVVINTLMRSLYFEFGNEILNNNPRMENKRIKNTIYSRFCDK